MKKAFSIIVLFLLIFQSSFATTYSSDPQTFVKEMVNDAINTLSNKNLTDLISAAQEGNPEMKNFETSIFDGNYICGSVTEEYLMNLEVDRKDSNKSPTKGLIN